MAILIKNGYLLNPATNQEGRFDVLVEEGLVKEVAAAIEADVDQIVDAEGLWVLPGLIDLHVHLREPGYEYKETVATGAASAVRGGFTSICCMPNTNPATDSPEVVQYILDKAKEADSAHVLPIGAVTLGQKGEVLTDAEALKDAGACALSEDGRSVLDAAVMRQALAKAARTGLPMFSHCEDDHLAGKGCMNEGSRSKELGLEGIPNEAEDVIAARDIVLAEATGARLHLCHVSTRGSVDLLAYAKAKGLKVTAEVCPHHFTLTEEAVDGKDTNTKMNPPLRARADVEALKQALKDGSIDCIATDHAPHSKEDKEKPYPAAANGIVGLETAVPLSISELVETGWLTPMQLVEKMSLNPARILGIDKGSIETGKAADIVLVDPAAEYAIDAEAFASAGRNTPFHGRKVKGRVVMTLVDGAIKYTFEQ